MCHINKFAKSMTWKRYEKQLKYIATQSTELVKAFEVIDKVCGSVDPSIKFDFVKRVGEGDDGWFICAQSSTQQKILDSCFADIEAKMWVEGPNLIWHEKDVMNYFVVKATLPSLASRDCSFVGGLNTCKENFAKRKQQFAKHIFMPRDDHSISSLEPYIVQQSGADDNQMELICSIGVFGGKNSNETRKIADWLDHLQKKTFKEHSSYKTFVIDFQENK